MMKAFGLVVFTCVALGGACPALAFPAECTAQFGYSAKCCAASYGRNAAGSMDNGQRHAQLAACTAKEKGGKR